VACSWADGAGVVGSVCDYERHDTLSAKQFISAATFARVFIHIQCRGAQPRPSRH